MSKDFHHVLRYARTRGSKYELRLYEDADGTYSVREFVNGDLQFASVGWATRVQTDVAFNRFMHDVLPEVTYLEQPIQEEEHALHVRS